MIVVGAFYILNGLLNALPKYPWQPTSGVQTRIYIDLLALLCALSQRSLPYHVLFVGTSTRSLPHPILLRPNPYPHTILPLMLPSPSSRTITSQPSPHTIMH